MTASFADSDESQLLCRLYRVQSRFRNGDSFDKVDLAAVADKTAAKVSPLLVAALNETRFMLEPGVESAMQLLNTYASDNMVLTVFTSHWAYKAGTFLVEGGAKEDRLRGRVLAHKVLERCALKWPNARALQELLDV